MTKPRRTPEEIADEELQRRAAAALAGVLGSFASSAAFASRIQRSDARSRALGAVSVAFEQRHREMTLLAEQLPLGPTPEPAGAATPEPESAPMASSRLRPISVPVPRLKRDIGLGEAVQRLTAAVGIKSCGGCSRRAAALNRAVVFRAAQKAKP